jgi:hypothetical protein
MCAFISGLDYRNQIAFQPCYSHHCYEDRLQPVTDWALRVNVKLPSASGLVDHISCGRIYVTEISEWPLAKHAFRG